MTELTTGSILHLVESLACGGAERMVVDLAVAQHAAGWQVCVASLFHRGDLAAELDSAGIKVVEIGKKAGVDSGAVRRLRQQLRSNSVSVLHSHNQMAHYYGAAAALGLNITLVNTRHGMGTFKTFSQREMLYRLALPFTDSVVSVCSANLELMRRRRMFGARQLVVVPNGISLAQIQPRTSSMRAHARQQFGLGEATTCFASVGRLNPAKNQASMIRAYAELPTGDHCLLIVGDGAERVALQGLIDSLGVADRVTLLGLRNDVAQLLSAFDVFVLSSISEGYSLALLEAAAAGLPIIATDVGGNHEIVHHEKTGYLVPVRDDQALTRALTKFLNQPGLIEQLGSAGLEWATTNASVERMVENYQSIYQGVG